MKVKKLFVATWGWRLYLAGMSAVAWVNRASIACTEFYIVAGHLVLVIEISLSYVW